jgi:hypothetical protein
MGGVSRVHAFPDRGQDEPRRADEVGASRPDRHCDARSIILGVLKAGQELRLFYLHGHQLGRIQAQ